MTEYALGERITLHLIVNATSLFGKEGNHDACILHTAVGKKVHLDIKQ